MFTATFTNTAFETQTKEVEIPKLERQVDASGTCGAQGDNLSWTLYADGELVISGTGAMASYTDSSNSAPWITNWNNVLALVIENGVTSIGERAFMSCSNLTSVTISSSVTNIGYQAFCDCSSLESIVIPEGVESIGNSAFASCSSLESIAIPESLTSIGDRAFESCGAVSSVTFGGTAAQRAEREGFGWRPIGNSYLFNAEWTYLGIISVTGVTLNLENAELTVGTSLQLTATVLPADAADPGVVWTSSDEALATVDQTGLVTAVAAGSATITVTTSDGGFTADCAVTARNILSGTCGAQGDNLTWTLYVDDGELIISGTGAMRNYLLSGAPWYSERSSIRTVEIASGVTSIGDDAFYECSGLTSITIPDSVTSIGSGAFKFCKFTSITIPTSLTSIGLGAFQCCSKLTSITIPHGVAKIEDYTFDQCSKLTSVIIPASVTSIGKNAFSSCDSLTSVSIPSGVTSIGKYAFAGCRMTSVSIPSGVTSIDDYVFYNCRTLTSVTIPAGVTSIGDQAFCYCSLTSVTIPSGVTSIGDQAFFCCYSLTSITIPESLLSIDEGAFRNTALRRVFFGGTQAQREEREGNGWSASNNDKFFTSTWYYNSSGPVDVTGVTLDADSVEILVGGTRQLSATVAPADATDPAVIWTSSDETVATVDQTGLVTAVAAGSATITVTTNDSGFTADCAVTVPVTVTGVTLNMGSLEVAVGEPRQLTATVSPANATHPDVVWTSSNEAVATVDQTGLVTAVAAGSATISVTTNDGGFTADCAVTVPVTVVGSGTCGAQGDNLTWTLSSDGELVISGTGAMANYDSFLGFSPPPWSGYGPQILNVTIGQGVTSISADAFGYNCVNLQSVSIPEGVTFIGRCAFQGCGSLCAIALPSGLTTIGNAAFDGCTSLTSITIPGSVTRFGHRIFSGCTSLWSVTICEGITSLTVDDDYSPNFCDIFEGCTGLVSITIPQSLLVIGRDAFEDCAALSTVYFGGAQTQREEREGNGWQTENNDAFFNAAWYYSSCLITFNANGGEGGPAVQIKRLGVPLVLSEDMPTRRGYAFIGWATASEAIEAEYQPGDEYTAEGDATLYALWSPITYTIRFNGNGNTGGATASIQATADDAEILLPNGFDRKYYTFTAWNTAADNTGEAFGETAVTLDLIEFANEQNEVTLYAQWEPLHYSIAFDANGGDGEMDPMAMRYSVPRALTPNVFARAGDTFDGWNTEADGKGTSFADCATVNNLAEQEGDVVTLYAQWKANNYTVAFDANSGTGTMAAQTMTYGKAAALTANAFTKANWQFVGWSEDPNAAEPTYANGQTVSNLTTEPDGTVTLYAVWVKNSYRIVFNANGGTGDMSEESAWCEYDGTYRLPLCSFERPGFEFKGWATSAKGKVVYADGQQIEGLTKENGKVITLYAVWKAYHYSILFDGNGADSGSTKAMNNLACGKVYTLTANGFKKTGYTFTGWNTERDGSGTAYANKAKQANFRTGDGDVLVLYAQWTPTEYRITYKNVATSDGNTNPPSYRITDDTIVLQGLSRPGCHFEGWYLDAKYKNEVTQIPHGSTGALTLYAKWSGAAYTYRIVFEPNGGTGTMKDQTMTCGKAKALTANAFKRAGYTFAGWNTHLDGSGEAYANKQSVLNLCENENGTVWLYAQWTAVEYKITYKNVCAFDVNDNPAAYSLADPVDFNHLNAPARPGCVFGGWYTDAKCTKPAATEAFSATGAKTLYAKWLTKVSYKIVFDANAEGVKGTMKPLARRENGAVYTLKANAFKRTGYQFLGWSLDPNAAEPTYANKAKVGNLAAADGETVTLYAVWAPIEYRITYRNVVGARVPGKDTYTIEETYVLPIPEKEGYIFLGWYTSAAFKAGTRIWQIGPGSTGNMTLYAKWMQRTQ